MKKQAVVICARCQKNKKLFGIRTEKIKSIWHFTWAFKVNEDVAAREGFTATRIEGSSTEMDREYPGCPYCGKKGFICCGRCGKICCASSESHFTCPHCGNSGEFFHDGWDTVSLSGGGY